MHSGPRELPLIKPDPRYHGAMLYVRQSLRESVQAGRGHQRLLCCHHSLPTGGHAKLGPLPEKKKTSSWCYDVRRLWQQQRPSTEQAAKAQQGRPGKAGEAPERGLLYQVTPVSSTAAATIQQGFRALRNKGLSPSKRQTNNTDQPKRRLKEGNGEEGGGNI